MDIRFLPELALTDVLWKWRPMCVPWKKLRPGVGGGGPKISTPDHWVISALALFSYLLDGAIESDLSYKDPV